MRLHPKIQEDMPAKVTNIQSECMFVNAWCTYPWNNHYFCLPTSLSLTSYTTLNLSQPLQKEFPHLCDTVCMCYTCLHIKDKSAMPGAFLEGEACLGKAFLAIK